MVVRPLDSTPYPLQLGLHPSQNCTDRRPLVDVVMLSRLQFALTIMFHYIFPPLTIGLGVVLVYLEGMFLRSRDPLYESAAKFWTKIFGLNFAIGVATGIV